MRRRERQTWLMFFVLPAVACMLAIVAWTWWAERHPSMERELREQAYDQLATWFPEEMALPEGQRGFIVRTTPDGVAHPGPQVLLLHGLDEPGGIWDDLVPVLEAAGIAAWEYRYPNDQAIDRSADLLADDWPELPDDAPVVLVGHSMGGLVIRDFVTRWRYPSGSAEAESSALSNTAPVRGAVMVGTPNHGSEWARLRVWLELRNLVSTLQERRFSLFASLRDGTGAAKIDLRPGSAFLADLNAREWPEPVPVRIIGGLISEPTEDMIEGFAALSSELGGEAFPQALQEWWYELGGNLGDGVVPVASLALPEAPPPVIVNASHRGMLTRTPLEDDEPPAIAEILAVLDEWLEAPPEP